MEHGDYKAIEKDVIGSISSEEAFSRMYSALVVGDHSRIAIDLISLIRKRSADENIDENLYRERLERAISFISSLYYCLNDRRSISDDFESVESMIWAHKKRSDLTDSNKDVWPIHGNELFGVVEEYMAYSYLQMDLLDWLLTDALIYNEVSSCKEFGVISLDKSSSKKYSLLKDSVFLLAVVGSFFIDKSLFIVLGVAYTISYFNDKHRILNTQSYEFVYTELVYLYDCCDPKIYNPFAVWEIVRHLTARKKGFVSCLYDLLQRQIIRKKSEFKAALSN